MEDMTDAPRIELADEAATARLAARLAAIARPGDVIALFGTLGTGKTAFARAFIQARGTDEEVPSPTFTLVQTYEANGVALYHFDLYRIGDPSEAFELDIEDAFAEGISLIEWPERLGELLPAGRLEVHLEMGAGRERRRATLRPLGTWRDRLARLRVE